MAYFQVRTVSFRECRECNINSRWWQLIFFVYVHPYLGKRWTQFDGCIIFQMGWFNRQLALHLAAQHFLHPESWFQVVASIAEGAVAPMVYELSALGEVVLLGKSDWIRDPRGAILRSCRLYLGATFGTICWMKWLFGWGRLTIWKFFFWNGMFLWFLRIHG